MPDSAQTLLFVDDEPTVLEILTKTFERRFNVLTASSGPEALKILKERRIDLLVTDQKMPGMTGIELVTEARMAGIDVTAILLTGYTDPGDLIAAINQGQVYRYLTKPWDVNDLVLTVKNALEVTALRRDKDRLLRQLNKRVEALAVLYDVTSKSANDSPTYDAIVERVLAAVARVLPYDLAAALVAVEPEKSATLRMRCNGLVGDRALLWAKDQVTGAHRERAKAGVAEGQLVTRVTGSPTKDASAPEEYPARLSVPLTLGDRTVGTICLFSRHRDAYSAEDEQLLDALANQTTNAISSLRAAEEGAHRRIERMVESMADGVILTDEKSEVVVLNPAARAFLHLGDNPAEWTSQHLQETLGFYPFELVRGWEYGGTSTIREELKLFDKVVQSIVTPVADAKNQLRGVVVVLRDVTEQKALEERKAEFVSIVSHELRTPLTSISGALDLVLNHLAGDVNDKQRRFLLMAKDSTEKLNAIVDDLLDLSKFAKGKLRMTFEVVHLDSLVKQALDKYGPALDKKKIRVTRALPEVPLKVLADPGRVGQVLNNLLTNAVKFAPEGGEVRVELGASQHVPGFATFSIWNSGDSIAEEDAERIFEKFEQARTDRNRAVRGTGLGLAISRSIVEGHGGRIWAEPVAVGARFVFVVPLEPTVAPGAVAQPEVTRAPQGPARAATVLVVEDEPAIAYVLKAMLLSQHYQVFIASSAEEGLAKARRHKPDVICLDIFLPDVDGLQMAEILHHDPDTRGSLILMVSARDERERAFRLGANAFLQKPLDSKKLFGTLESLVRGKGRQEKGRVLVVDDDEKIAAICREVLANLGFEVSTAGTVAEARTLVREKQPDVVVLDIGLPDGDGFSFMAELKAERAFGRLAVIFVSAQADTSSKVRALKLGGDDYLTKPFDPLELGARIEGILRRKEQELGSSPTTQLPGSGAIEREVLRRLGEKKPFAFCYLDLDNLKAYNDYYGYAKADGVIRQTGDLLREVTQEFGKPEDFLGHVAGDDFVFLTDPETVDRVCNAAIEAFDRIIPLYYNAEDRERGYIEAEDRFGQRRKFPIMSVSIVAVVSDGARMDHPGLAKVAAEMKKKAKAIQGSVYLRNDREAVAETAGA